MPGQGPIQPLFPGAAEGRAWGNRWLSKASSLKVLGCRGQKQWGGKGGERAPDFFLPHLASAMEGLPVAPRGQAAKPTHGEPTLLTSGKRKEAVSPARGGGREGMRPQTPGTTGMAGGGPLTAHAGTGPASHPPSPGARLGPREDTTGVTWRLKSLCSSPFLGGAGGWPFQSRSGGTEPSSPKTFSSWKHSVSTICHRTGSCENCPPRPTSGGPPPAPPSWAGPTSFCQGIDTLPVANFW